MPERLKSPGSIAAEPRVRWFTSLAFKLALLVLLGFYVHDLARPGLYAWSRGFFVSQPEAIGVSEAEIGAVYRRMVVDPEAPQRDAALRDLYAKVKEHYARTGVFAFVADPDLRVIHRPELLRDLPVDVARQRIYRVDTPAGPRGRATVFFSPIHVDEVLRGWRGHLLFRFVPDELIPTDAPAIRLAEDSPILARMQQVAARSSGFRRASTWSWVTLSVLVSVVFSLLISVLITRRLRRLARDAARSQDAELTAAFTESGRDEIAVLARVLNERRGQILDLVRGMREKDRQRREWVAQVSHDLRTPLTAVEICLQRLNRELGGAPRRNAELAMHDCRRLRTLADNLLEIGRLEMGQALDLELVLPQEVVDTAARSVQPMAEDRGIALEIPAPEIGVEEIEADGGRLLRACENLLRNALRHAASRVRAFVEVEGGVMRFVVEDDGEGFAGPVGPVRLDAFEKPGSHLDSSGLGLVVTRHVAEAHRGQLMARNQADGWTRVWIEIPRWRPDARAG